MSKSATRFIDRDHQTIVALATPRGSGAIALIRLSGDDALTIVSRFARLSSGKSIIEVATHTIHHGQVVRRDEIVDDVLFMVMRGPRTFTGQTTIEISSHNNPFIIDQIIQLAIAVGARHAMAGEFTRRAFEQGKIDLVQAESINELIGAHSEQALKYSLQQLRGNLSQFAADVEAQIVRLLAHVEASFEFLDEEQRDLDFDDTIHEQLTGIIERIDQVIAHKSSQQHIREGVRIALIGSVNAGKSSLFNALLGKDRAIVTEIAGTTRDSIEAGLYRDGVFWTLVDTAGLRIAQDVAEKKGIVRSREEAQAADVVLLVIDGTVEPNNDVVALYQELYEQHRDRVIIVETKQDIAPRALSTYPFGVESVLLRTSSVTGKGVAELHDTIARKVAVLFEQHTSPFLLNERQHRVLSLVAQKLRDASHEFGSVVQYELIAYHLRDILELMTQLTGKNVHEKMLDEVFSGFCVGK